MNWWLKAKYPTKEQHNHHELVSRRRNQQTPFTFPAFKSSVGRLVMKLPSTTGTKTKVPKKPLSLMSKFATWRELTSTVRKHSSVSWVDEQLKLGLDGIKNKFREIHTLSVWQPHYTVSVVCLILISMDRSNPLKRTHLWNAIVIVILRWQEARARNRGSEKRWRCTPTICDNML